MKQKRKAPILHEIRGQTGCMRREEGEDKPKIVGDFIVFNSLSEPIWGWYKEEIKPGAADRSLKGEYRDDIAGLFDHQSSMVLGSTRAGTMTLKATKKSVYGEIDPPNTSFANDLLESLERGDINSASFGFFYKTTEWRLQDDWDVLEVKDMDVMETTVCKFPAYRATQIGIRSYLVDNKDVEPEALPVLCRAYNRLENSFDMTEEMKSNLINYRNLLFSCLPDEDAATLRSLCSDSKSISIPTPPPAGTRIDLGVLFALE